FTRVTAATVQWGMRSICRCSSDMGAPKWPPDSPSEGATPPRTPRPRSARPGQAVACLYNLTRLVVLERLRIDEDEEHPAHAVAPIRPGVIGPALNQHVAWAHEGLVLVQDRPDLALETDRVVYGVGRVESGVPR